MSRGERGREGKGREARGGKERGKVNLLGNEMVQAVHHEDSNNGKRCPVRCTCMA